MSVVVIVGGLWECLLCSGRCFFSLGVLKYVVCLCKECDGHTSQTISHTTYTTSFVVVVVDLPLLRVAVEGSYNPRIQDRSARRPFHLASRGTILPGDIQRSSMLLEVSVCSSIYYLWYVGVFCTGGSGFRRLCVGMKLGWYFYLF